MWLGSHRDSDSMSVDVFRGETPKGKGANYMVISQ